MNDRWYRVTKNRPCAICERPDWCTYADGVACCMRVKSDKELRNGGWLHRLGNPIPYIAHVRKAIEEKPIDSQAIWQKWFERTEHKHLDEFGVSLGVDTDGLKHSRVARVPLPHMGLSLMVRGGGR